MKKALAILFLSLFISAQLYNVVVYTIYTVSKNYITDTFCINKDKPKLKCNGKCHLSKSLAEAEKEQKDKELTVESLIYTTAFTTEINSYNTPLCLFKKTVLLPKKDKKLVDEYLFYLLDPPKVI